MNYHSNEIWKDIPDYLGYQVSNLGRIRSYNKITYKDGIIRHWKNRILKQKTIKNKYLRKDYRVELWQNGKHKTLLVARLVAFTFYNQDINNTKLTVNHIDGNSENNKLENLEIISLKDNINHAFDNKLHSSNVFIKIIDSQTNEEYIYRSMTKASLGIQQNKRYISEKIKKGIFENKRYKWELYDR